MKTLNSLLTVLIILISFQLRAQFSLGIQGGYTKAWEEYGDVPLPDDAEIHVTGFNLSTLFYYQVGKHFRLGLEPGYVQRGAACYPGYFQDLVETKFFLKYVEMPLMIFANLPVFQQKLEFFGKAGYGVSFLAAAIREQTRLSGDAPPVRSKLDLPSSNLNRWDHGFYGGIGLGYNIGVSQIFFEYDYYHGLPNVLQNTTTMNRSMNVNLGYMIRL